MNPPGEAAALAPRNERTQLTAERDALRLVLGELNDALDAYWTTEQPELLAKIVKGWQRRARAVMEKTTSEDMGRV